MFTNKLRDSHSKLSVVTPPEWKRLSERRIFFGHQSVGENLVAGLRAIVNESRFVNLRIIPTTIPQAMSEAGFYHGPIGANSATSIKLSEFDRIASTGIADSGIAMMKFCYVDVDANTDAGALFSEYRRTIDSLRARHPELIIVHVTLPLQFDPGTLFHWRTVLRGKQASYRTLNAIRQRYNDLLHSAYHSREPIFDLARLESTRPDGTIEVASYGGAEIRFLARDWTSDGGHLNPAGQRFMAEELLITLAKL